MKSAALAFLESVLGEVGAKALAKASGRSPGLEPVLVPRAALAWVKTRNNYQDQIPGVKGSTLSLKKSQTGYSGSVSIGDELYVFSAKTAEHVAAAVAVSVGVDVGTKTLRDPELQRLGKTIDALVQTQEDLKGLSKSVSGPKLGFRFSHEHHDLGDEILTHIRVHNAEGQEVAGAVVGHSPSGSGLYPYDLDVHPQFRRQGIATAMYDHAQKLLGKPVIPSRTQTPDAQALWAHRLAQKEEIGRKLFPGVGYRHRQTKEIIIAGDRHDRLHPSIRNMPDSVLHEDWEPGYIDPKGSFSTMAEAAFTAGRPESPHRIHEVKALAKTDLPGTSAKPQKQLGPLEPEAPQKQTANMSAKPKLPKMSTVIKVEKSELERGCDFCGGGQFKGLEFRGCICLRDLRKHAKTSVYGETVFVEFGRGADPEAVAVLRKVLNG